MILPTHGCRFQRSALPDEDVTMPAWDVSHPDSWFRSSVRTKVEEVHNFDLRGDSHQRD